MLGRAGHHLPSVEEGGGVERGALGLPDPGRQAGPVDVADDHGQFAQALPLQAAGHLLQRVDTGVHEGRAQHEVLDRVAGEEHLGEDDEVSSALGGVAGPRDQPVRVGAQVAYGRVRLCQGNAQLCHANSLVCRLFYRQSDEKALISPPV